MLEYYFKRYLNQALHLSGRSVDHYISAIRTLGTLLNQEFSGCLFNVASLSEADRLISLLKSNPYYVKKNFTGNNMYSAALNHFRQFLELSSVASKDTDIACMDSPKPKPAFSFETQSSGWARSPILKEQVIKVASYNCEVDSAHDTFISKISGFPYMEAHHIIPIRFQGQFDCSLDVYSNILCVCPNCHRLLHYGTSSCKQNILENLYQSRHERFYNCGIILSLEQFLSFTLS
jgi:5-methylcytosine-specific restriction protein A